MKAGFIQQEERQGSGEDQVPRDGDPGIKGSGFQTTGTELPEDSGQGDGGGFTEGRGSRVPGLQAPSYPSLAPRPRCRRWRQTPACICSAPAACVRSFSAALWCPPAWESRPRLNPSCPERAPEPRRATAWRGDPATEMPRSRHPGPASAFSFPLGPALPPGPAPPRVPAFTSNPAPSSHQPLPQPQPHLLQVLLGPQVRGVHERAHNLDVAVHNQRLIRPVRVDAHTTVVEDSVRHLRPLPQHVAVALKLARVGGLAGVGVGVISPGGCGTCTTPSSSSPNWAPHHAQFKLSLPLWQHPVTCGISSLPPGFIAKETLRPREGGSPAQGHTASAQQDQHSKP